MIISAATDNREDHHLPEARLIEASVFLLKLLKLPLLPAEDLDDLHSGQMLGQEGVQGGETRAHNPVGLPGNHPEEQGQCRHHRDQQEGKQRHPGIQGDHDHRQADHLDHIPEQLDEDVGEHLVDGLHVIGQPGHDLSDRGDVKEAHGQLLHMAEKLVAQIVDNILSHLLQQQGLGPVQQHEQEQRRQIQAGGRQNPREPRVRFLSRFPVLPAGGDHALVGLAGDIAVDGVSDDHGADQLQPCQQQHQDQAQDEDLPVRLQIPDQTPHGFPVIVNVLPVLILGAEQIHELFLQAHAFAPPSPGCSAPRGCSSRSCFSSCCRRYMLL